MWNYGHLQHLGDLFSGHHPGYWAGAYEAWVPHGAQPHWAMAHHYEHSWHHSAPAWQSPTGNGWHMNFQDHLSFHQVQAYGGPYGGLRASLDLSAHGHCAAYRRPRRTALVRDPCHRRIQQQS